MPKLLRIVLLSLAIHLLPMKLAHADLIAAFINGVPVTPGQLVDAPAGGRWAFVPVPGVDLFYQFYVSPPVAPPPPKTFRIQDPTGRIIELGDGTRFKAEQKGKEVIIHYRDGETAAAQGKLIKPGEPNPAPPGPQKGVLNGPRDDQAPPLALKQVLLLLAQPELADLFPTPIDLSYFKYDFFGTDPFPAFRGSITFTTDTGLSSTLAVLPEPGTMALAGIGILAWLALARKRVVRPLHLASGAPAVPGLRWLQPR